MTPFRIRLHKVYIGFLAVVFGILILGFIALMTVLSHIDANTPDSRVQIVNNASVAVERGSVEVAGKRFDIGRLSVGESVSFSFRPYDSGYRVVAILADGRTIDDQMGYVTGGMAFDDRIFIDDNGVTFNDRTIKKRSGAGARRDENEKHAPATRPGG